jgi:hypothetical protein
MSQAPSLPPEVPLPSSGARVLGFGLHTHIARGVQNLLRTNGFRADAIAVGPQVVSSAELDSTVIAKLQSQKWDALVLGAGVTAQGADVERTPQQLRFFNRLLNLLHLNAPGVKLVLVSGPGDALARIREELGEEMAGTAVKQAPESTERVMHAEP